MAEVIPIKRHKQYVRETKLSAAGCLREVRACRPTEVLCIGYGDDGHLFVRGSPPDPANAMWLMELAKRKLCAGDGNG